MNEVKKYLDWKASYAPTASIVYKKQLDRFFEYVKKDFDHVDISDIAKYISLLNKKYSGKTIELNLIILKNFFSFYAKQGRVRIHPDLIKSPRIHANSHQAITEGEHRRMLESITDSDFISLRNKMILMLLWDTGVRVSELCGLNLCDIDIQGNTATIKTKKNQTHRRIFWSPETAYVMKRYAGIRISLNQTQQFIVGKSLSSRITPRQVQRIVKGIAQAVGITKKLSPHSYRHGWAHYRRDKGAPLAFIQKGLGHANPASTFVYEQYADPDFEKAAKRYL